MDRVAAGLDRPGVKRWLALALLLAACGGATTRTDEVADRGALVMPFDLDGTTHRFRATAVGGVQTVVADDPGDRDQIALVRQHLQAEAASFGAGDFGDPAAIHGHDMPGLTALAAGADDITVTYVDVDGGGRITFETARPDLVVALHEWFDAQLADHGSDAERG